ncbi:hypothetical protein ACFS5N_16290 [Mucilaginibacter ximonensis]|uniref:Major capsid protein n=1 Tax=Mucilaginibacter ximonensis TaxID=538021 RepID=A0ABW5YFH6_9SPHI
MPQNFPEMWESRVEINLTTEDQAPFLAGIPELDTTIIEVGSGSASEQNIIHIPTTDFEPDVLINNNAYPLALQQYDDDKVTIQLDKYQTKVVTLTDDQTMGASYVQIDAATGLTTRAILKKKYGKAVWALGAAANTVNTPVITTTGMRDEDQAAPITDNGRLILVYADLVALKKKFDDMQVPADGRRIILCSDHWNDLLLDRKRFGDLLANYKTGDVAPMIAGFEIYQYINNPIYDGTTKQAYGSVPADGQYQGSVAFYVPNIAKKTGMTKQYFKPSALDPENQTNRLAYRHYFICVPKRNKYIGVIASASAA